mgnify:CR=1 FL=1
MREELVEILSVAGIIGVLVVVVALIMAFIGVEVPSWLSMAVGTVVGFFYGNKGKNGGNAPH